MTHPIPPRSRFPFQPALIAAVAVASLLSAPARAQQNEIPANIVSLSASGHLEVPQDWLSIQLSTTREGADPVTVQNQLKQALDAALAIAQPEARPQQLEVRTGSPTAHREAETAKAHRG